MTTQCKAEVLGKLFVIPGTLCVLPDHQTIVDFVNTALNQIVPGTCFGIFLFGRHRQHNLFRLYPDCSDCATNWDRPSDVAGPCALDQVKHAPSAATYRVEAVRLSELLGLRTLRNFYLTNPISRTLPISLQRNWRDALLELTRRTVQDQLHQVLQELESEVADRTAELARRNAELEQEIQSRNSLEKALRLSEERYRSLTIATTQIVWTTNPCR